MSEISITSEHFTLIRDYNAFGETFRLRKLDYTHVFLIQPTNEWFQKQWDQSLMERNQRNLLRLLEAAYEQGRRDTQAEIQKALGIK